MTHDAHDHDFRQFAGRFDAPVAPSPAFAVDLRSRLGVATFPASVPHQAVATEPSQPAPLTAAAPQAMNDELWRAPRWMRALEAAMAVLLVVSLAGASLYFRQPEAVFDLAFQPAADTVPDQFNYAGDAGRTWVLGDVEPAMGSFREDPPIRQLANIEASPLLVDDSYICMIVDGVEHQLIRYDLTAQEAAWTVPLYITGTLASDGELIFGMRSDNNIATDAATLVAIDFETGAIAWEGPELANRFLTASSLVLAGDSVYATDYLGNIVAVDRNDGSLLWQYPETFAMPSAGEDYITGPQTYARPEIAVNDAAVFLSQPSRAILALDRETGETLGSVNLVDQYGADIIMALIQVHDQRLVLTAIQAPRSEDPEAIRDYTPSSVLLFDAGTLELQHRTERFDFRGNPVLTEHAIYVPTAASVDGHASIRRVDLATGDLSEPLDGVSARWDLALSVSGTVLMATGDPSTIAFFDLQTGDLLDEVELGITGMESPLYKPVEMWGDSPVVITASGMVYVVVDESAAK